MDNETVETPPVEEKVEEKVPTEKDRELAKLEGYYGKVTQDLSSQKQLAEADHAAAEAKIKSLDEQHAALETDYNERKAKLEGAEEPVVDPAARPLPWTPPTPAWAEPKPEPKPV
jgi:chromosome segregation ATPase